jgi:hypothetical protein
VPTTCDVQVSVKNSSGTIIRTLFQGSGVPAGSRSVSWDGKNSAGTMTANAIYSVVVESLGTSPVVKSATGTITVSASTPTPPPPTGTINTVQTILDDMRLAPEGYPHGVPSSWDWYQGAVVDAGNNPGKYAAVNGWGQVYTEASGNPATNTRVQVRDIRAFMLSKRTNTWRQLQYSHAVDGEAFYEDFRNDYSKPGDVRTESDGSTSVKLFPGFNFHFWPQGTLGAIDPTDVGAIFVTFQARLVVDDPAKPDDRSIAKLIANCGQDYYMPEGTTPMTWIDGGVSRFKYVTSNWRAYNYTTGTSTQLNAYPPPLQ